MKAFRRIWSVITTIVVILIVFLAIALVGVRVFGLTPYTVLSGSMEPTYHVGSLIYVKEVEPSEVEVGDPITFVVNEDLLVATHRVVEIDVQTSRQQTIVDENGEAMVDAEGNPIYEETPLDEPAYYFTTKGDANDAVDGAQVYYKNLLGEPVFTIPYLGYLSSWIQTKKGMIISINVALILLLLTFLPDLLRSVDDEPKKKKKRRKRPA